jgi:hypothetical protein
MRYRLAKALKEERHDALLNAGKGDAPTVNM